MKSTGEVMGIDKTFELAFFKAQLAAGNKFKISKGNVLISVEPQSKNSELVGIIKKFQKKEFGIYATSGTAKFLTENGIKNVKTVNKEQDSGYTVIDLIKEKKIDVVINTSFGSESAIRSFGMRRAALMNRVFYITTISAAKCFSDSIQKLKDEKDFEVFAIQKL